MTMEQPKIGEYEKGPVLPEKIAIEMERKVMALDGVMPGDSEKQEAWINKNGKRYREIFENNKKTFLDIYKNPENQSDLPQIIKMALDQEK